MSFVEVFVGDLMLKCIETWSCLERQIWEFIERISGQGLQYYRKFTDTK